MYLSFVPSGSDQNCVDWRLVKEHIDNIAKLRKPFLVNDFKKNAVFNFWVFFGLVFFAYKPNVHCAVVSMGRVSGCGCL